MNVPFVTFQYRDLKDFRIVYLQASCDFQKMKTHARENIFSCGVYIFASQQDLSDIPTPPPLALITISQ